MSERFTPRDTLKELNHDLDFLKEIHETLEKWRDGNCWESRDHAFTLVEDWISEIERRIAARVPAKRRTPRTRAK